MRWKPIEDRRPPEWLAWTIFAVTFPVWAPIAALILLDVLCRKLVPEPGKQWHKWFAWRPVRVWTENERQTVWLETIERRNDYGIDYRLVRDHQG